MIYRLICYNMQNEKISERIIQDENSINIIEKMLYDMNFDNKNDYLCNYKIYKYDEGFKNEKLICKVNFYEE